MEESQAAATIATVARRERTVVWSMASVMEAGAEDDMVAGAFEISSKALEYHVVPLGKKYSFRHVVARVRFNRVV